MAGFGILLYKFFRHYKEDKERDMERDMEFRKEVAVQNSDTVATLKSIVENNAEQSKVLTGLVDAVTELKIDTAVLKEKTKGD